MKRNLKEICLLAFGFLLLTAATDAKESVITKESDGFVEKSSQSFVVQSGGTVYIDTAFGTLIVNSWDKEEVALSVEKATDVASESDAKDVFDGFSVSVEKKENDIHISVTDDGGSDLTDAVFQLNVPRKFNLDLETDEGKIEIGDLEGNAEVESGGGSISTGRISGTIKLVTAGGSIHIDEGGTDTNVKTNGGSINIGPTNGDVYAKTNGGSITTGFAKGRIEAVTNGGSINIGGSDGPIEATTNGGAIHIDRAHAYIEAKTNGGKIEATLSVSNKNSDRHCTLETRGGDVTIHLPEDLPATFDAELIVEKKRRRKRVEIISDFALDIKKEKGWFSGTTYTASGDINGGGNLIKLSTRNSFVYIKKLDP